MRTMQLPLSFMSAFFTIDIRQFSRDETGSMSLGYVSAVICEKHPSWTSNRTSDANGKRTKPVPISAAISAILVYVAFNLDKISAAESGAGENTEKTH